MSEYTANCPNKEEYSCNMLKNRPSQPVPTSNARTYICKWEEGTSEEHKHGRYGVGICEVCGRCATCGLKADYHTMGGGADCVNALGKRLEEVVELATAQTAVIHAIANPTTCRCGRPAVEHECEDCHEA